MGHRHHLIAAAGALALLVPSVDALARDRLLIVGSSTVFPYSERVVERFAAETDFPRPELRSTGTGGGFEIFCAGTGGDHPDLTGASRPITRAEWERCQAAGVDSITEVLIGYDGLTLAYPKASDRQWSFTRRQLFDGLAATVPVDGELVPNPHTTWADVDPALPAAAIRVLGPPETSGTRDSLVELVLEPGCRGHAALAAAETADPELFDRVCSTIRTDGAYIEAGEDDAEIVKALEDDATLLGVFGYSNLFLNEDRLAAAAIDGVRPDFVTISTGAYPLARPLFIYIKNNHRRAVPGMTDFIMEYVAPDTLAPHGYLVGMGLTPVLDETLREEIIGRAMIGEEMRPPAR